MHDSSTDYSDPADYNDEQHDVSARWHLKLIFVALYTLLFLLGTVGNGYVIVMIWNVFSAFARLRSGIPRKLSLGSTHHVFVYILGLSIVDLLVILHLPLLIFEMLEGEWIFGQVTCKLYWYGESVNKLLSSFLMTVLSWDRYMAVCMPLKSFRIRTISVSITVLLVCAVLATLLLAPVLSGSTVVLVNRLDGMQLFENTPELAESNAMGFTIRKCVFYTASPFFMLYTFAAGYVIPAALISAFYALVIIRLRANAESVQKHSADGNSSHLSTARLHRVAKRIVAVILFYFSCWTPYWTLNIMSQFGIWIGSWSTLTISTVFFSAHLLVCFNSAANPLLYALINRELRHQHLQAMQKRRQSLQVVTHNALEFIEKHSQRMLFCSAAPVLLGSRHLGAVHERLRKFSSSKEAETGKGPTRERAQSMFFLPSPTLLSPTPAATERGRRNQHPKSSSPLLLAPPSSTSFTNHHLPASGLRGEGRLLVSASCQDLSSVRCRSARNSLTVSSPPASTKPDKLSPSILLSLRNFSSLRTPRRKSVLFSPSSSPDSHDRMTSTATRQQEPSPPTRENPLPKRSISYHFMAMMRAMMKECDGEDSDRERKGNAPVVVVVETNGNDATESREQIPEQSSQTEHFI